LLVTRSRIAVRTLGVALVCLALATIVASSGCARGGAVEWRDSPVTEAAMTAAERAIEESPALAAAVGVDYEIEVVWAGSRFGVYRATPVDAGSGQTVEVVVDLQREEALSAAIAESADGN